MANPSARRSEGPLPSDVPGYVQALAEGRVRSIPPTPPGLLPGKSARELLNGFVLLVVALLVVAWPVFALGSAWGGGLAVAITAGCYAVLALAVLAAAWRRVGRRNLDELDAGYTTLTLTFGAFTWVRSWRPTGGEAQSLRLPWNYSGIWVLEPKSGHVTQTPDRAELPPGFYPSPHRTGQFELWTGASWAGTFRRP